MKAHRPTSVGVHIGQEAIRLVAAVRRSGHPPQIVGYKAVPLAADLSLESEQFPTVLSEALTELCGTSRRPELWASLCSAATNARSIRIPTVRHGQVYSAAYWTFRKETPFDDDEVLFDLSLEGETLEDGSAKTIATAYTVPLPDLHRLRDVFAEIGFPLTGVTLPLFATQSLCRAGLIPVTQGPAAVLYVGDAYSRISVLDQGAVVLTRGVKSGMAPLIESIASECAEAVDREQARTILLSLDPKAPPLEESGV